MQEPSLRTSRLVIAGGLVALIAMGAAGFLAGRGSSPAPAPPEIATPTDVPSAPAPEKPSVLQRGDIIAAAYRAADAHAAGRPVPREVTELAGRRFDLVIPFGCDGPAPADSKAPLRWRYDEKQQTLRIHVARTNWRSADWGIEDPDPAGPGAEGFWISRPWTSSESCARSGGTVLVTGAEAVTLPGQTLAVAQFGSGEAGSDRSASRAFDLVKRLALDRFNSADGFRLRLAGRVRAQGGRPPILCFQPAGGEQRPICVVSVSFEEVAVEIASSGERLGTWPLGQPTSLSPSE